MGLYDKYVLPRLIDTACGMGDVMKRRAALIPQAQGDVLEIGIGTGLNLAYYDKTRVTRITGVDPAAQMQALARQRSLDIGIPVDMVAVDVRGIHADAGRFDTIVMTFTLCSIEDPIPALREMKRVLGDGGRLLFCEHGLAPEQGVKAWQHCLTPWWKPLAGGCHLNRDIPALIQEAGFVIERLDTGYIKGPRPMTFLYEGVAIK
ncbi:MULTISPECIES: class I SAM-dependent methyltransferase [Pseudomonas]|jgi:ubiquinone/menaquinone biosynthesis C-methylase UbiE|uniref:SAM-dependent methyltransferase n=1 Tax=Pseudomonas abyssi TaxID=170540 RepID=A0A2A3MNB5_9PSED|nr:class I SAM-dependent methyltransferase [Pseudomonas abyssi]MAD00772.1 class I SAM-dependent methyltransferase [Pseudomonadales bacterium]PBK06263.1 SAM-dependent methyltransferase [Pseudomonas abyssi]|tara:strand:+ start:241 stop:855 length:615 start_codon:yes stop_codon:yes gene_type:complete